MKQDSMPVVLMRCAWFFRKVEQGAGCRMVGWALHSQTRERGGRQGGSVLFVDNGSLSTMHSESQIAKLHFIALKGQSIYVTR